MNNSKNSNYEKLKNIKSKKGTKIAILACLSTAVVGTVAVKAIQTSIEEKKVSIEENKIIEMQKQKEQEELERIKKLKAEYPGVSENGLKYVYDANEVWRRLQTYDYSSLNGEKVVFLTYDDGPSTTNTPVILDTLKKHDVRATFFVTGKTLENGGERAKEILKESYDYGNAIANHSYSHDYKKLYPNRTLDFNLFLDDFNKTDKLLKDVLGNDFETNVWRCPGGYMSWKNMGELKEYAEKNDKAIIDWNALNKDAEGKKKNADELYQEAVKTSQGKDMVVLLMHDTYGKEETAKYTDKIIQYYKDNGYVFKTLA